ncbi:calcium-binding protein [Halorubrum rutilum]|uniref:Calcium-binding protein n=1 Tax=Halorubrum rutilum TaxID=1364933 RepID=A0ABD6AHK3_9EURY|nr:calcium-binding protein [Halorubrum rutilum]
MTERDEEREERIEMRVIVDAYTVEEQAYGWHAYLDDLIDFPFEARCTTEREESPLKEGETVRVVGMSSTEPTLSQQYVTVEWMDRELGVPLEQLEPVNVDDDTKQAIEDWYYWLER